MDNRIQKLLCSEYDDFNELIIIECPFAQTTRDGNGIKQLQIGLTPTKLVMACDYLIRDPDPKAAGDPEIETLELLSVVPLESVTMSIFRRRTRNTIKAHFSNGKVLFFELAVSHRREMFWNLWCDKLRVLAPEQMSSTQSETSIGSSSSTITSYTRPINKLDNSWQERDLFLGSKFGTWATKKKRLPKGSPHIPREADTRQTTADEKKVCQVNRFGAGINENCSTSLFLPAQVIVANSYWDENSGFLNEETEELNEHCWERRRLVKHPRRYGLSTMPHLMSGMGLWALPRPQATLLQLRRWSSEMTLRNRDPATSTCIPKSLLVSSISSESLLRYGKQHLRPPVVFWTPGFWYKPRMVCLSYHLQQEHLTTIKTNISEVSLKKKGWFRTSKKKKIHNGRWGDEVLKKSADLRSQLMQDIALSSWDFDSTLIAYQITLIDKDLFIRIPAYEFEVLLKEGNSRNAPNFRAMVAFSNRLSNLITTEVIRIDSLKMRARLTARWVNVADKLLRLQNMQGVRSVLCGLQSAAVYRLSGTWAYLRNNHNSKYRRMTTLMRLNRDPRSSNYRQMMCQVVKITPYLMSMDYLVAVLFGWTGSPSTPDGGLGAIERFLPTWMAAATEYGLTDTPLAKEFLTKARYLEELDSFILASQLEPTAHVPYPK